MTEPPVALASWTRSVHTAPVDGRPTTHDTWRKGAGPGVIVIHEMPGLTTGVIGFGEELVAAGYTVVLPHLFGPVGRPFSGRDAVRTIPQLCVSREFTRLSVGRTSPVATWLRSLAHQLHADLGGPGVGALGMCFTGGFALAMMVDAPVVAPVLCQPASPTAVGAVRAAAVGLSAGDLDIVRGLCVAGREVLGVRYASDRSTGTRFDTLTRELGPSFLRVELPGHGHSTVTEHRSQVAVDAVLGFFARHLQAG